MSSNPPIVIRVSRRYDAPPEEVFDAWLDPAKAGRFLFATPAGKMTRVEIDARVGGGFTIVVRRGEQDAAHFGEYLEIDRPRRLVFLFTVEKGKQGTRVTVDIEARGRGCELTLTHEMDPEWEQFAERTRQGWTTILESLARVAGED